MIEELIARDKYYSTVIMGSLANVLKTISGKSDSSQKNLLVLKLPRVSLILGDELEGVFTRYRKPKAAAFYLHDRCRK